DPGTRVGQPGGLEQRLDGPVLAEGPVQGNEREGPRVVRGEPIERRAGTQRTLPTERCWIVVGRRRPLLTTVTGRQPPPAPVEIDQDEANVVAVGGQRLGDRRSGDDRHVVLGRWTTEEHDDRRVGGHGASSAAVPGAS